MPISPLLMNHDAQAESGLSLLEVLLSVAIATLIIMGAAQMVSDWGERARLQDEAGYLIAVHEEAKNYVAANFGDIMSDNTFGFDEDLASGTYRNIGKVIMLRRDSAGNFYRGMPPPDSDAPLATPLGRNIRAYIRHLGEIDGELTLQVITATDVGSAASARPLPRYAVKDIASAIGADAGIFSPGEEGCSSDIYGVFGNWALSGDALSGERLMSGATVYCPDVDIDRNVADFVVLQDRVSYSSVASDQYLYRMKIDGLAGANRMETNLDMNGNPIENVSSVTVDNMIVNGNAMITSKSGMAMYVDEFMRIAGEESVIEANMVEDDEGKKFLVNGNVEAVNMTVSTLNQSDVTNGSANVILRANDMTVSQSLQVDGDMGVRETLTSGAVEAGRIVSTHLGLHENFSGIPENPLPPGPVYHPSVSGGHLQVAGAADIFSLDAGYATIGLLETQDTFETTKLKLVGDMEFGGNAIVQKSMAINEFQFARQPTKCKATIIYDWDSKEYVPIDIQDAYNCNRRPNNEKPY